MARTAEENAHRREDDMTIRIATIEVSHATGRLTLSDIRFADPA
jgi:hypothetical protein